MASWPSRLSALLYPVYSTMAHPVVALYLQWFKVGVAGGTKLLYCLAFLLQFIILHCTVVKYFEPHHLGVDRLA